MAEDLLLDERVSDDITGSSGSYTVDCVHQLPGFLSRTEDAKQPRVFVQPRDEAEIDDVDGLDRREID